MRDLKLQEILEVVRLVGDWRQCLHELPEYRQQRWHVVCHRVPQYTEINAGIVVHQFVPEPRDIRPWNFGMAGTIPFRNIVGGFAENDEVKDDGPRQTVVEKQLVA